MIEEQACRETEMKIHACSDGLSAPTPNPRTLVIMTSLQTYNKVVFSTKNYV